MEVSMKLLAWYSVLFTSLSIAVQILSIGRRLGPITPVGALVSIILTVPVLLLGIQVIKKKAR